MDALRRVGSVANSPAGAGAIGAVCHRELQSQLSLPVLADSEWQPVEPPLA